MNKLVVAAVSAAAVLIASLATPAAAGPPAGEPRCRDAMALAARRAAALTVNVRAKCIKQRTRKRLASSVDCSGDPPELGGTGTGDARTDIQLLRLAKARDKQVKRLETKCKEIDIAATVGDACSPTATNPTELAECVVITLGKAAGDDLTTQLLDIPQQVTIPPSGARKCYEIVNRAIRAAERRDNALRAECFAEQAKTGGSFTCLATVAPPGTVQGTGYPKTDEGLLKRYSQMQGNIRRFCVGIDFDSIGFQLIQSDPTPAPFTLDDLIGNVYDSVLDEVNVITRQTLPPGAVCGDGNVDAGEQCDDGNRLSCDGCDRDCTSPACGNAAGCSPEHCDDGNTVGGDGCDATCVSEVCGNGVAQPGEECDDGVANSDTTPDACRTDCDLPACGDSVIDTGESCDPPNGIDCEPDCTSPSCGDGITDPGEECDDGAGNSDTTPDACRVNCTDPTCGDNVVDSGEQCDPPDGGVTCKADCTFVTCGNGLPDAGEECDDGAGNSDTAPDACRTDCTNPGCGDGVTDSGEACDDSGESATCDDDCTAVSCGDSNTNEASGEDCDDGNPTEGDGCDTNCTFTGCPNGIVTAGEFCDQGGETVTCDDDCTAVSCGDSNANQAAGEDCDTGGESASCDPDCTDVVCGDGYINTTAGEECEDGNMVGGDGCSALCACGPGSGESGCQDPQCPGSGELTIFAGTRETACTTNVDCEVDGALVGECDTGLGRCTTVTGLDTGWTGISHGADINDAVTVAAQLSCPGPFDSMSAEPCGECDVAGLDVSNSRLCRCSNDNGTVCTEKFGLDAGSCSIGLSCTVDDDCKVCDVTTTTSCVVDTDCPSGETCLGGLKQPTCSAGQCVGTCDCFFGPPLPLSAGNTPACAVNKLATDIFGTANVDLGSANATANLKAVVYLGELITVPCPYCTADITVGDGVKDGTCVLGEDAGKPCDVDAPNGTFPSPTGDGHSLDCAPTLGKNVSGLGLNITLNQTTGTTSLTAGVECGFTFSPELCQCGVCDGDGTTTCTSNADCVAMGGTTCSRLAQGRPSAEQCTTTCTDSGDGITGVCDGPTGMFCDGVLRANGDGFVACGSDLDCDSTDCGSGTGPDLCGDCTLLKLRDCFLPTITAVGAADPATPIGAAVFCIPETANAGINGVAGLPGPARVVNQGRAKSFCANDPGTQYTPGVGGCP